MSKPSAPRRVAENEAMAVARVLRTSPRKLNLVAASIRGLDCQAAMARRDPAPNTPSMPLGSIDRMLRLRWISRRCSRLSASACSARRASRAGSARIAAIACRAAGAKSPSG